MLSRQMQDCAMLATEKNQPNIMEAVGRNTIAFKNFNAELMQDSRWSFVSNGVKMKLSLLLISCEYHLM